MFAIVLPAGSGKSTLATKHEYLVDIDALHTQEFKTNLWLPYYTEARQTGDWEKYDAYECDWLRPRLAAFTPQHVLLVHSVQKAERLGLTVLGVWKTSRAVMERVAAERHDDQGIVAHNWDSLPTAQILDTHADIECAVLEACQKAGIMNAVT